MSQSNLNQRFSTVIYANKDNQGNLTESQQYKDIFVPFKSRVPPGGSTFDIPIPKTYLNRTFSFDNIMMIPDAYVHQAEQYNEETEEELEQVETYDVYIRVKFLKEKIIKFYGPKFLQETKMKNTLGLVQAINAFFEFNKPTGIVSTPVFFDWLDLRFKGTGKEKFDEFYQRMATLYYGEKYDPIKHFNALPLSARKVYGVNNYLFPTIMTGENFEFIRLQLTVAPNTFASFSTELQLMCMGFSQKQIGPRYEDSNNFAMINFDSSYYSRFPCQNTISSSLTPTANLLKMFAQVTSFNYMTEKQEINISKRAAEKNQNFELVIKETFQNFEVAANLKFGVIYHTREAKFEFLFPDNQKMTEMQILIPSDLAERLGFDLTTEITPLNNKGKAIIDYDPKETEDRARALAHDTGLIIVSDYNTGTNTTSGINEKYMAALYPTETGSMVVHVNQVCNDQPVMTLEATCMTEQYIPATFLLSKFLQHNKLVNLIWNEGLTMQGALRGVHPLKHSA